MDKQRTVIVAVTIAVALALAASSIDRIESQEAGNNKDNQLDSTTLLLDFKKLPPNEYIILYSVAPETITSGSIVAKLPCDDNSDPDGWMLLGGVRTDLEPIKVELIQGNPGSLCAYGATIPNESAPVISGVVLVNAGGEPLRLPRTSSIVITAHEVSAP